MTFARRGSRSQASDHQAPRVLVIEDEPDILELLADTLSLEGFQVRTSEAAVGVLSLIRRTRPDLIILDLRLPGISGVQLLPLLASDAPDVPLLIASGAHDLLEEYSTELHCLEARILEKPFTLDQFLNAVKKTLAKGHRQRRR